MIAEIKVDLLVESMERETDISIDKDQNGPVTGKSEWTAPRLELIPEPEVHTKGKPASSFAEDTSYSGPS